MWNWNDIEAMNPAEPGQRSSFLSHLIEIGAASEDLLCRWAEYLEHYGSTAVACFCQLPFPINVDSSPFKVRGWREGVVVDFHCEPVTFEIDLSGKFLARHKHGETFKGRTTIAQSVGTQVIAVISLWNVRAKLYDEYIRRLTPKGLNDGVIGKSLGWMRLPSGSLPPNAREYTPLSAAAFQGEVARRLSTEVSHSLQNFVSAYSIGNLEEIPRHEELYGYFIMIAPGRVACGSVPLPVQAGFIASESQFPQSKVNRRRVQSLLEASYNKGDQVLTQLMAMKKLLAQKEPELALVGLVTAIEWFLNERFPGVGHINQSGRKTSASIYRLIKSGSLAFLSEEERKQLIKISQLRNEIVHGSPPGRTAAHSESRRLETGYVTEALPCTARQTSILEQLVKVRKALNKALQPTPKMLRFFAPVTSSVRQIYGPHGN
ncbi:hypothetical protein [Nitrosococcus watsonii]|uniref:Apea-like HEPN domain-containing protein n=1 Tax=Nitrosococcus watsoni (strain C-113) TaxID=105559 RepID=D8KC09_NITWC|nr:hypothetical protein [Nitrosococcus watsonii]ADJ29680.1 hypothetical protein Nwat_2943 [Nitrosococcus watsonii C-113]